ncbi:MAG: protein kinase [Deltaproteobacteria bacterium]|nr:protein kinase [Deltaproteobacteria bacterium]
MVKEPIVGDVIDQRYVLRRQIARGGMGAVFEAEQRESGRVVALKVVHRRSRFVKVIEEQLLVEAQAIAAVRHPGIVELLDVGVCATNGPYLALEMLVGRTLDGIVAARRRLPLRDAILIGIQICEALAVVHERRIVHRDLKPSNVFIALEGGREVVKLFDFGIAALGAGGIGGDPNDEAFGTPEYMAPEQLLGEGTVDHRVDVYAAGVTLYECLTGDVPFSGMVGQVVAKLATAEHAPRISETRPDASDDLDDALQGALAINADRRFMSAQAMGRTLASLVENPHGSTCLLGEATPAMLGELDRVSRNPESRGSDPRVQRLFERVPYVTVAEVVHGGAVLVGKSEDISLGGMLVRSDVPVDAQTRVKVRFALPGSARPVDVGATVRWSRAARSGEFAIGLQFVDLQNECRKAILDFVRVTGQASAAS